MADEKESTGTEMVPVTGRVVTTQQIEDAGLMMPLADPAALRAAFAERQRVLTSILDPNRDFIYSIRYFDREGKQRTMICQTLEEAKKQSAHVGGTWSAHPKKSGVLKLAHALGIESRLAEVTGLPKDQRATFSSCRYIATHKRTGRSEEGQGYCDKTERGSNMQAHAIISMADTRAYCHAVLRCAGYDNVGADEMELDDTGGSVTIQNVIPVERERPALVAQTIPKTVTELMGASAPPAAVPVEREPQAAPAPTTAVQPPAAAAAPPEEPSAPPVDPGKGDLITSAMAGLLSKKLLAKLGSKEKAREWLVANAGCERSILVREDQFSKVEKMLDAMETP